MSGCHTGVAPRSRSALRAGAKRCAESECMAVGGLRKSLYKGIDRWQVVRDEWMNLVVIRVQGGLLLAMIILPFSLIPLNFVIHSIQIFVC